MSEKTREANGHHKHDDGSSTRSFTADQKAAVIRVRKCSPTAFYDILGLEASRATASESEIKKAYRKLSLLTHPDKNGYPGADEAFKMVSRAFQVLSDEDKKAKYDRFGGDPESRFGSGAGAAGGGGGGAAASGANPFSGFAQQRRGGPMFEEEISPEELFRQFFGGGGGFGGGPFGGMGMGGPGFVFNMGGGPGIRVHQFGGGRPRRRPHNHENPAQPPQSLFQALQSLLPLLLLLILPLLSSLFSGSGVPSGPQMRFDAVPPYTEQRTTSGLRVKYFVNPTEVLDYSPKKWKELDKAAEHKYIVNLSAECEWEQSQRQRLANDALGFFFTDHEKLDRAKKMEMPSCKKLTGYGYRLPNY